MNQERINITLQKTKQKNLNTKTPTYIDLIVVKALLQVLQKWVFRKGLQEDHVPNSNHVV